MLVIALTVLGQFPLSLVRFSVPIYGENLGFPYFYFGLMGSAYGAAYTVFTPIFGKLADRIGQTKVAFLGLLTYALSILVYLVVVNPYYFVLLGLLQGLSQSMIWPQIEAITSKHGKTVESAILTYTLSWSSIAAVAPILGSLLLKSSYFLPLWTSFLLSLFGIATLLFLPREKPAVEIPETNSQVEVTGQAGSMIGIILPMLSYGFIVAIICSFYPAYGLKINLGVVNTGIIYSTFNFATVISFVLARILYSRLGVTAIVFLGFLVSLLVIGLTLSVDFILQIIVMTLVGFGTGFVYFGCLSSVFKGGPRNISLKTGIFEASIGSGVFAGPLISGIPTVFSINFPWIVIFSGILMILVTYAYITKRSSGKGISFE